MHESVKLNKDLDVNSEKPEPAPKKKKKRRRKRRRKTVAPFYRHSQGELREILTEYIDKNKTCLAHEHPIKEDDLPFKVAQIVNIGCQAKLANQTLAIEKLRPHIPVNQG